jgi:hypothetical protein
LCDPFVRLLADAVAAAARHHSRHGTASTVAAIARDDTNVCTLPLTPVGITAKSVQV